MGSSTLRQTLFSNLLTRLKPVFVQKSPTQNAGRFYSARWFFYRVLLAVRRVLRVMSVEVRQIARALAQAQLARAAFAVAFSARVAV